ncbi:MAG: hypothetical protein OQL06_05290 [Gammaproteobacteria bacterium]|nr:hypothetical protein [Gammaproteobacteria bacterium]
MKWANRILSFLTVLTLGLHTSLAMAMSDDEKAALSKQSQKDIKVFIEMASEAAEFQKSHTRPTGDNWGQADVNKLYKEAQSFKQNQFQDITRQLDNLKKKYDINANYFKRNMQKFDNPFRNNSRAKLSLLDMDLNFFNKHLDKYMASLKNAMGDNEKIELSEQAQKDLKIFIEMVAEASAFQQSHDRPKGFSWDQKELQTLHEETLDFKNNQLKDITKYFLSLQKKYNTSADNFTSTMHKVINPIPGSVTKNFSSPASELNFFNEWLTKYLPDLEKAMDEAKQVAKEEADRQDKSKQLVDYPSDSYSGGDLSDIKQQMLKALNPSVIKNETEVLEISVTSDWKSGIYRDTKIEYRKIQGTVLFHDKDNDGISRFMTYVFISDKTSGNWSQLKFKAFCMGCPEGWSEARGGTFDPSSSDGTMSTLLWLLLSVVNIVAGMIAAKAFLNQKAPALDKVLTELDKLSIPIGLAALALGVLGFVYSFISLNILASIIPQLTAVLLGLILAYDTIKKNAKGKLKDQIDQSKDKVKQLNVYSQTIGLACLGVGLVHLILGGSLYII